MPILTGFMFTTLPLECKTQGNSIANLFYNIFGYFPAPFVYGFITSNTGGDQSRWGLGILMFSSIISCSLLLGAVYLVFKDRKLLNFNEQSMEMRMENHESLSSSYKSDEPTAELLKQIH